MGKVCRTSRAVGPAHDVGRTADGRHDSGRRYLSNRMVIGVRDVHIARAVQRHAVRIIKPRCNAGSIDSARCPGVTGICRYHPGRCHLPDRVVAGVGDEHVAGGIHCHAARIVKAGRAAGGIGGAGDTHTARQRRHHARRRHLPDCVIIAIRHRQIARVVHRHAGRIIKPRRAAGGISAARNSRFAGQCRHQPRRRHLPERVVTGVRHI